MVIGTRRLKLFPLVRYPIRNNNNTKNGTDAAAAAAAAANLLLKRLSLARVIRDKIKKKEKEKKEQNLFATRFFFLF